MTNPIKATTRELIEALDKDVVGAAREAVKAASFGFTGHELELEDAINMFKAGRLLAGSDRESKSELWVLNRMMTNYGLPAEIREHVLAFEYDDLLEDRGGVIGELADAHSVKACYIFAGMITIAEVDKLSDVESEFAKRFARALGLDDEIRELIIAETKFTQLAIKLLKLNPSVLRPMRAELLTRMAAYDPKVGAQ